ncbi:MAG: PAS domain-containing protein [Pseudomonadota bacterium]
MSRPSQPALAPPPSAPEDARRYRAIVRSAVDFAIIATDPYGIITEWNPGAEHILQWSQADMLGSVAERFFTPEDRASGRVGLEMHTALVRGRASDERWHLRKDGTRFWANGEMMPLRADDGAHLGYVKILRDFTVQREVAEVQRLESEFMQGVLASSSDCIKVLDLDARLVYMNEGGMAVMELDDFGAVRGHAWPDYWQDEGKPEGLAALEAARAGAAGRFQIRTYTFKGSLKFWDVEITPILGRDGQPERLLAVSRDVTGAREAERLMVRSQERLELALGVSDMVGIWDWDLQAGLLYADARFARFYGVDPARAEAGAPLEEYVRGIHPDDMPRVEAEIAELLAGVASYACDYRVRQSDGNYRWVAARGKLVRDDQGAPARFPGAAWDITSRKQAEEIVQQTNQQLESRITEALAQRENAEEALRQSQKMEAVGQLTGGLAHDFNNLLASISGSLELLKKRVEQGRYTDLDRYIGIARGATQRAAALTHRLLAFSRRQTLDPKPTDANRLIQGMEDLIRRTVGPEIRVDIDLDAHLWPTLVDPHQLENALLNLCINGRDAMADGGTLTVKTANQPINSSVAEEWNVEHGDYVALYVTDAGSGMSTELVKRVFEPFFTTKPLGMGTGLGLSMVYGFARQSGGDVRIHSEVGLGTSVCIYLPRHTVAETVELASPAMDVPRAVRGQTVLVVDDEPSVRLLVLEILREAGYAALEAADGASAMAILRSDARLDLLVTDVGLPGGMNGRQIADAARMDRPGLPVLFVTGYAEGAMSPQMPIGMHLMPKPFGMDALVARVKQLIDG